MSQSSNQLEFQTDDYQTDTHSMAQPSTPSSSSSDSNKKKIVAVSAAALLLGGASWAIARKIAEPSTQGDPTGNSSDESGTNQTSVGSLPEEIDVAGKVTESMSFEQAFKAARDEVGMGGVFSWHGRWYNTFEKDEWSSLSLEQRQEFTEMITQEHLPVKPYHSTVATSDTTSTETPQAPSEPTIIEGHLNGERVMGLDFDHDGIIDTLVMEGEDGYTYRVIDATGDDGLDTIFKYDSLNGDLVKIEEIQEPFMLSNDQFSQGLEESMSKEVVDSILEPDPSTHTPSPSPGGDVQDGPEDEILLTDSHEFDDTYVNDGDVHDMDE